MAGLGDLMQPGGAPGEEPASGSWSDLVKDPIARSALMGFGLQMMTGGWGNGTQQLAAGLGAGNTSAAATSEAMQKQMEADDKSAESAANHAADRQNRLEVAKIGADSRVEQVHIRGEMALERARLTTAAKIPPDQMVRYRAEARKIVEGNLANMALPQAQRSQMIEEEMARIWDTDQKRRGIGTAPNDSQKPADAATVTDKTQTGTAGTAGKPTAQNPAPAPAQRPEDHPSTKAALSDPQIRQMLATPAGQAELRKMAPGKAETLIRAWNIEQQGNGYTHKVYEGK